MFCFLKLSFGTLVRLFRSHHNLLLENLVLRQQLEVLKKASSAPKAGFVRQALLAARPSMLVRLETGSPSRHARNRLSDGTALDFRWYWRMISKVRKPVGRRQTPKEIRDLIFQMMAENPNW